jgi:hypothetical protein
LAAAVRSLHCVMSDEPAGLIALDRLDTNMSHGCPNWVDVTGRTYFGADRSSHSRAANTSWQRDLTRYLRSGQAVIILRADGDGMTATTFAAITRDGILVSQGRYHVYATDPAQ